MVWAHGFVVAHGIVPWYCMWLSLYKAWGGSIVNCIVYYCVLDVSIVWYWMWVLYGTRCGHCIVLEERLWEHEEEVQWFCCRAYPFIFLDCNKRTGKFLCGRSPSFWWTTLYLCLSVLFQFVFHLVYWFNCISVIALRSCFLTYSPGTLFHIYRTQVHQTPS